MKIYRTIDNAIAILYNCGTSYERNTMNEPQETIPLLDSHPATAEDMAMLIRKYANQNGSLGDQHLTVEINGEYYQASLAITKEDDILDAGHLVIRPIL